MSKPTYDEMRTRADRIYDERIKESVLAGIEVLKAEYGDAWVEKINCKTLDLRDGAYCILGQVCGSYTEGLIRLGGPDLTPHWSTTHGFNLQGVRDNEVAWDYLDQAWHDVLCSGDNP